MVRVSSRRINKLCKEAKCNYFRNKVRSCGNDKKKLFELCKTLMNTKKSSVLPQHTSEVNLAKEFASFFSTKIQKIRDTFDMSNNSKRNDTPATVPFETLDCFQTISEDELHKIIMTGNSKSCSLDPIPTTLLKACINTLLPVLCKIVNLSLSESSFPTSFKAATVNPLLKKPTVDPEDMKNYRPVSNLPYMAKITEKVIVEQLNQHMTLNSLHEPYRKQHCSE